MREDVFDTGRLQAALDACPHGEAVELAPGAGADAYLTGPIRIPGGVTLLIDAGVSLLGSRRPADYATGALPTSDSPCGGPCRPLIEVAAGASEPAALAGFGVVDGRGRMALIEAHPATRTWFDLQPAARPALVSAAASLFLNRITLRDAPADAVHFTAAETLLVDSVKILSSSSSQTGTRGIVVENAAATLALSGSSISVGGANLTLAPGVVSTIDGLRVYAGAGIVPGAAGHNGCVAGSTPSLSCLPAVLPADDAQLFASTAAATNLRSAAQTTPVTLHAVLIHLDLASAPADEPVVFFDGSTLLGEARRSGTEADFPLPALAPGAHTLSASFSGVRFGAVQVTAPAALHALASSSAALGLQANASSVPFHTPLQVTATAAADASGAPATGTVQLAEGSALLGTASLSAGVATFELPSLALGSHTLEASYAGDATHPPATSAPLPVQVVPAQQGAPFVLSASRTTVFAGQPFTLSALGFPADASGTVTFTHGGAVLATLPIASTSVPELVAFGDSITTGFRLSMDQAYPALLAAGKGMNLSNLGLPGVAACDLMTEEILPSGAGPTEAGAPLYTLMAGSNDAYSFVPERAFIPCQQAAIAWLAIPREYKVLAGDSAVQALSPAWQYAAGSNFDTLYNASGSGTVRFPITSSGNPIYLWYLLDNQAPGTFSVFLDGGATSVAEVVQPLPGVNSAAGKGILLLRFAAPAGRHTVDIEAHSPAVAILGVGTAPLAAAPGIHPTVLVGDVPNQDTAGPRDPADILAQLSLDAQQNVATLAADGLDVRFVATRGVMLGTPSEMADAVHPNALGQAEIAGAFNAALGNSPTSAYTAASNRGVAASLQLSYTGVQSIAASYSGDALYLSSHAAPIAISVVDASTLTTLTVSAADVTFNTPVTLTATILPAAATGHVTFYDQGSVILGDVTVANGIAALTVTLPVGTHALTAILSNSDGRQPSNSFAIPVVVERPVPTLTLTPATQSIAYGQFAAVIASVLGGNPAAPPTGTVSFADLGAGPLGQAALVNGQASFPASALSTGLHTITARYAGDSSNGPASGPTVSVRVLPAPSAPNLFTATPAPSFGTPVSVHVDLLTAATPPSPAVPASFSPDLNRTAVFMGDSITAWWPLPLNNRGIAGETAADMSLRFAHDVLGQGFERVILLAGTNDILHTSRDPATTLVSIKSMTDLAVANGIRVILCTLPPMDGVGSAQNARVLALNAAIAAFAQQNGFLLVDFYAALAPHTDYIDDGVHPDARGESLMATQLARTLLVPGGTVALADGTSAALSVTGTADLVARGLPVGTSSITVAYSGDTNFQAASASLPVSVGQAASATTLHAQPLVGYSGSAAVLSAAVGNSTSVGATGAVTFSDGATALGSAVLGTNGVATLTTANLKNGMHSFTAAYAGDTNFSASASAAVPVAVRYLDTSVTLSTSGVSFLYATPVTLTAAISAAGATGTVTFLDGSTVLAQQPVANGGASFTIATLVLHGHNLTASYSGDSFDSPATSPVLAITINPIPTTLTLAPLAASVPYGQAVVVSGSILPADSTGQLTLSDLYTPPGGSATTQALGPATLSGGTASFSLPAPAVGTHVLTATYSGDLSHIISVSAAASMTVVPDASTTVVTGSATSAAYGTRVSFTVQVSPAAATGSITLRDSLDGTLAQLPLTGGMASWSSATLSPGVHAVSAAYAGDPVTSASVSPAAALTVTPAPSSVALAPLPASQLIGHPLTLSAAVTPASATGSVVFRDASNGTLGQAPVVRGVASLTLSTLPVGSYTIAAAYSGDSFDQPSTSASAGTQIDLNPSSVSLAALPASAPFGTSLTLTATVVETPGSATGLVHFFDGAASLGSVVPVNGVASFPLGALALGAHSLHAGFSGDALNAASNSAAAALTITPDNTATTLTLAQTAVPAGSPVIFNVQVVSTAAVTPSGSIAIRSGTRVLALATLAHGSGANAYATVSVDSGSLGLGSFPVAAFYSGDADSTISDSSANPVAFSVVATPTSTVLSLSASRVPVQTASTLTATVASATATATGTVTFLSNGVALATVPVSAAGIASTTLPAQAMGSYTLAATYSPTGLFAASAAAAQTLTVTAPLTAVFTATSLNAASNSTTEATVAITPLSGFTGAIAAQCVSTASFLHCTVDAPATVTGPVNLAVHVTVPASLAANASTGALGGTLAAGLLLLLPLASRRRLRAQLGARLVLLVAMAALTLGMSGCATGGNFNSIPDGAQTVSVTVTAAGVTTKATITVNVGP